MNIQTNDQINLVNIYDITGKLVQTKYSAAFTIEKLQRGMYCIQIKTTEGVSTQKFLKE